MKETKILCIHGIGGQDKKISIQKRWKDEISKHLKSTNKDAIYFMRFDKCFTMQNANIKDYVILFYDTFLKKIEKAAKQALCLIIKIALKSGIIFLCRP